MSLQRTPEGPQLRDSASGQLFPLTGTEADVLEAIRHEMTADEVVSLVERHGFPLERSAVGALLSRLAAAQFLMMEGSATPHPVLGPDDVVPQLRSDLVFAPAPRPGMVVVRDLRRGHSYTFYELEITIARMLDGKRTLGQVVAATKRLGLPATEQTLRDFMRQLDGFGFLATTQAKVWLPEIREMFHFAVNHARSNRDQEATEYLEALLEVDPDVHEAQALLEQLRRRQAGEGVSIDFEALLRLVPNPVPAAFSRSKPGAPSSAARAPSSQSSLSSRPTLLEKRPSSSSVARGAPASSPSSHIVSKSLPKWTLSMVLPPLPEVSDSVLSFEPKQHSVPRTPVPGRGPRKP